MSIVLTSDQYESFYAIVSLLKEQCNDIDIVNGKIRQKTNAHDAIFDIDLTSILQDITLPFTIIKQKIDLLRMFLGSDTVEIDSREDDFVISDNFSKISFVKPNLQFIDNPYMDDEEISQLFSWEDQTVLLSTTLSLKICERMKIIASNYNITAYTMLFNGDDATLIASTDANDQSAEIVNSIPLDMEISNNECNLQITPFIVDRDSDTNLTCYVDNNGSIIINKIQSEIKNIDYTIYSRTQFNS